MFLLLKLRTLYATVIALESKFPGTQFDAGQLFADVEAAILTKSWTLAAAKQVIADAEQLVTDFAAEWTGGQVELQAFVAAFRALFAIN